MKPFCHTAAILMALLAFSSRPFAAEVDDDSWSKISARLVIGKVALQLTNQRIHITGSNLSVTLPWPMPRVQDYVCAVRNPFAEPALEDGFVQSDANFRILKNYKEFKLSAFPRFPFFTNRPTTIGLLAGHAAANGSSTQKLLLVDVEAGAHKLIALVDGQLPSPASAWDGSYELVFKDGEGEPGEQIYHFYLTLWTERAKTRALFNGMELSDATFTRNGFSGTAAGGRGEFQFRRMNGTNAITLKHVKGADWYLGFLDQPLLQTRGAAEAGRTFKAAQAEIQNFDDFLQDFQSALGAPASEQLKRLKPLFRCPLSAVEAGRLLAADYSQPVNRLQRGPFVYVLSGRPRHRNDWPPCLVVKQVDGQFKVTRLFYAP